MKFPFLYFFLIVSLIYIKCKNNEQYISFTNIDKDNVEIIKWLTNELRDVTRNTVGRELKFKHIIDIQEIPSKKQLKIQMDFIDEEGIYEAIVSKSNNSYILIDFNQLSNVNEQRKVLDWLMQHLKSKNEGFNKISNLKKIHKQLIDNKFLWSIKAKFYDFTHTYEIEIEEIINTPPLDNEFSLIKFEPIIHKRQIGSLKVDKDNDLYKGSFTPTTEPVFDYRKVTKLNTHRLAPY